MQNHLESKLFKYHLYQYQPLEQPEHQIRLLKLLPGKRKEAIALRLQTSHFDDKSPPVYEALSYAWGNEEASIKARVGHDEYRLVTPHLYTALRHLRLEDKSRML
jgi:hypothetical protein